MCSELYKAYNTLRELIIDAWITMNNDEWQNNCVSKEFITRTTLPPCRVDCSMFSWLTVAFLDWLIDWLIDIIFLHFSSSFKFRSDISRTVAYLTLYKDVDARTWMQGRGVFARTNWIRARKSSTSLHCSSISWSLASFLATSFSNSPTSFSSSAICFSRPAISSIDKNE
jgi:hypothetical protein